MKRLLKAAFATGVGQGIAARLGWVDGLSVLTYHRVTRPGDVFDGIDVDAFRAQMRWLVRHCRIVHPGQLDDAPRPGHRSVLVTFDDGYRSHHDLAFPILHELGIPHVVFLPTGLIDSGDMLWTDEVAFAVRRSPRRHARLPWQPDIEHPLREPRERLAFERACKDHLKTVPDDRRRDAMDSLWQALELRPGTGLAGRQMMNWDEVRAITPLACVGGHTHTHPILSRLSPKQADDEIRVCRDRIAAEMGCAPTLFAYPNGRPGDFTDQAVASLQQHGFRWAFTTQPGIHRPGGSRYAVPRQPTAARDLGDFAWLVWGRGARQATGPRVRPRVA